MKTNLLLTILMICGLSFTVQSQPKLNSHPSAKPTIFIDFDGHFIEGTSWNRSGSFYCQPAGMSDAQVINIFNRVAEDFRPFNVNITTDSTVYLAAPIANRVRVVVTPTSDWYPGVGGVAFTGSFTWGDDTPAFVFTDKLGFRAKNIAECISHESGHTLGLSHQAKYNETCSLVANYNEGTGNGEIGWAPVMGNSYGKNLSGWNNGPTPYGCTQEQDNLSIITSRNGFTYREDDHSNDPNNGPSEMIAEDNLLRAEGIISTNTDKDAFKFNLRQKSNIQIDALPFSVGVNNEGANLDVKVVLLNEAMEIIGEYDPKNILHVSIDTVLNRGVYYAIVSGAGNPNTTNYGSLGSYTISAMFSPMAVLPIHEVKLKGKISKEAHELSWNIISDTPAEKVIIEKSDDGTRFLELGTIGNNALSFTYRPEINGNIYYRLKAISQAGQVTYSNTITLKSEFNTTDIFKISTMVQTDITIQAKEEFKFQIMDITGRSIKRGTGKPGLSTINMSNSPNGIYFIQIINNNQKITQRILKL
jgi:hypothetical protein